ncbi:hypothetical protein [Kutzneria kofuensis]|uniref:hypothetical protein n=1 Tax=Kutzneria kofuensis TaxID=103725 RepID=UPI0031E6574D
MAPAVEELLKSAALDKVEYYQISARALDKTTPSRAEPSGSTPDAPSENEATPEGEERQDWHLMIRVKPHELGLRARLKVENDDTRIIVDAAALYKVGAEEVPPKEVVVEFIKVEALPTLIPFIREAAFDSARRLGVTPPNIPHRTPKEIVDAIQKDAKNVLDPRSKEVDK